ncbi:MAG: hypothetical protein IPL59_12485 [Candidatus Competibacteraceae bacterium]|nr:hypothetical protein [Candidatus Competibacteraceae bacterium]
MNVFNQWASRLQETTNKIRFQYEIRGIVNTPPVKRGSEPFTLLSMVHHRDVDAYLLAVKSFCRFLAPRRFIMIMDPSITEADQNLVSDHIRGIEFYPSVDYRSIRCLVVDVGNG